MRKNTPTSLGRRAFLSGATGGAAVAAVSTTGAKAAEATPAAKPSPAVTAPSAQALHAETQAPAPLPPSAAPACGADFMVDVMRALGIEYMFSNAGSSFRGLQESIINYAGNTKPEFITCLHEEASVAMAHGYAKASGKPAAILAHGTVGLQHASMALYNAWCDKAPVITMLGNSSDAVTRPSNMNWRHSAQDPAALVRDFIKWDDNPHSLQAFAESMVRAHKLAITPPAGPVAITIDSGLQEMELHDRKSLSIPRLSKIGPPQGDLAAVREAAALLAKAERPVIIADRMARTQAGMDGLVQLAELLGAPVIDQISRQNFPTTHPLCQTALAGALLRRADVILGLECMDFWGTVNTFPADGVASTSKIAADVKLITLGLTDIYVKSNYQDFQRYAPVDLAIAGDGEATLPSLIEAVKAALPASFADIATQRIAANRTQHAANFEAARQAAAVGWGASPVSTARLNMELWNQIKDEDWALVSVGSSFSFVGNWAHRLWKIEKQHQFLGLPGGGGLGYGISAAIGAAMANKELGRFSVNIQPDGDLMYTPGALWTAAHHQVPLLSVMHNNRCYGQEMMHLQVMANRWNRGIDKVGIGTAIDDPFIDYAKLAQSMGVWAEGPITDPEKLAPALKRAIAVVKSGRPALLDVVTQLR